MPIGIGVVIEQRVRGDDTVPKLLVYVDLSQCLSAGEEQQAADCKGM